MSKLNVVKPQGIVIELNNVEYDLVYEKLIYKE